MTRRTRRIRIMAVRRRTWHAQPPAVRVHCPVCGREVETLAAAHAAEILEVAAHRLSRLLAEGRIHAIETVSGSRRVCRDSLFIRKPREDP